MDYKDWGGNMYFLKKPLIQNSGNVAPQRVSASIIFSILGSIVTVSLVISWLLA